MEAPNAASAFGVDDVLKLRFVAAADLSPDGRRVVYAVTAADVEAEQDRVALHLLDVETGARRQLTAGRSSDSGPAWSPDGSLIAFVSDRAGAPQIFVISPDGGEARQLTTLEKGVAGTPAWSPDGAKLAFAALGPGERRDPARPYRVTRAVYRFDQMGYIEDGLVDIHVVDIAGGEPKRLTDDDRVNAEPRWTPDGDAIVYVAGAGPTATLLSNQLRLVDLEGRVRDFEHPEALITGTAFAPDGRLAVLLGIRRDVPIGRRGDLLVLDLATGSSELRTTAFDQGLGGGLQPDFVAPVTLPALAVTPAGEALATVQVGGRVGVWAFSLSGPERVREVIAGDRFARPMRLRADRLLFHASSIGEPGDLYLAELGGTERRLTELNADLLRERSLPGVEHLAFRGADGTPVEGWFLRPGGVEGPAPTVLYIHGGPHGGFGHTWSSDMQLLCGAGFGVLMVNQRGSTGYGDEFATSLAGHWGEHDYRDLMAGVDHAIERGLADPDRLGVCGISGGGNLTCWIVGHTDRFKAAVPENPVTNFLSFYGVADIGPWFAVAEMGCPPWVSPEAYLRQSPITYAHRCTTPTLLVQGEADLRCPAEQSEQFYAVLKANGCVVEMLRIPNSSHTGTIVGAVPARRAQNEALLDWMNRYVLAIGD
ncbi:MAG TPA: S9 family peptidase [Terriglobales bacterium]|nr:S9 family peptidase [Terriglobales bacterium]